MPFQNRVDPFGAIHAVAARGLFTGNRGVIHDPGTRTLLKRRWTTRAWLICECAFQGRRRDVMGRNGRTGGAGWTELFFLDEVTALAAGHRPCFYCRRERAQAFARSFAAGQGRHRMSAPDLDVILHRERRASGGPLVRLPPSEAASLPDGAMVERDGRPFAVRAGKLLPWDFGGYGEAELTAASEFKLITPPSTVAALKEGYRPVWHPSATP
ncbi:hypothetical protein [Chelativorans sp.]|uniref:hypothetical protein n=1 Tax=Chelativorans sp. TaxID=2203393 RepID=UPI0028112433|nr:hypothetical protein [Chelativorans sp.]